MKERKKGELDKLVRVWSAAHRSRPVPPLGVKWLGRLMGRIRREAGSRTFRAPVWIDQFVWRAAAAAAVFALIFAGSALLYTDQHRVEVVSLLSDELDAGPPFGDWSR
jgi:anti-sigma-K factor RskA